MAGQSRTFWVAVCVAMTMFMAPLSKNLIQEIGSRDWEDEKGGDEFHRFTQRQAREMLMTKESVDPKLQLRG